MSISLNDELDSIFGIPKDGSNIKEEDDESQETSYAEVITAKDHQNFEQKSSKLKSSIASDVPPTECAYIDKEEEDVSKQSRTEEKKVEKDRQQGDKFEKILENSVRPQQPVSVEVLPVVQESSSNNKNTKLEEDDGNEDTERFTLNNENVSNNSSPNENGWLLTSPSPMYNHFYSQKASLITTITRTGVQLPIVQMLNELRSSYVNTSVEMSDLQGMYGKLTEIQNYLDRVVQIKILATAQCAATRRGLELLRGVLAKVCYEKPAARQDGVNYDHLRDIEMYSCQVESLEQSAKDVYHNLLEAKEILSRKISVAIELFKQQNMGENIEKNINNLPSNVKQAIHKAEKVDMSTEGFDRLDVQEAKAQVQVNKTVAKKTGQIDWFD